MGKVAQYVHPLRVNVPEATFERLKGLAHEEQTTISQLARYAIRDYLKAQGR
jgi:predicted transcriptional regulator